MRRAKEIVDTAPAPATTPSSVGSHTPSTSVDVAHVRELLENIALRHRNSEYGVESGDDPPAAQHPVKDTRKCDYTIAPVVRRPRTASSVASGERGRTNGSFDVSSAVAEVSQHRGSSASSAHVAATAAPGLPSSLSEPHDNVANISNDDASVWQTQLQLHVLHLLQRLRARPEQLRAFLCVHYEHDAASDTRAQHQQQQEWLGTTHDANDASSSSADDDDSATLADRNARCERVHQRRINHNLAHLRAVFATLHRIAVHMGERLFAHVRAIVRRSVASGALSATATNVRLMTLYKLELRRQVTIDALLAAVRAHDTERKHKQKRYRQQRDEKHVQSVTTQRRSTRVLNSSDAIAIDSDACRAQQPQTQQHHHTVSHVHYAQSHLSLYDPLTAAAVPIKTAHAFRMHALECVVAAAAHTRQRHTPATCSSSSSSSSHSHNVTAVVPCAMASTDTHAERLRLQRVSEQTQALIHEKLMALLYTKSRDAFPVWHEPPESTWTRDETLRQLERIVTVLLTTDVCTGLSVDHVIECVRLTTWRTVTHGAHVVKRGAKMDELVLVMDGWLEVVDLYDDDDPRAGRIVDVVPYKPLGGADAICQSDSTDSSTTSRGDTVATIDSQATTAPVRIETLECLGELGLLSTNVVWPATLVAGAPSVRLLVLSRTAFDAVLRKVFGGSSNSSSKCRPTLAAAASPAPSHPHPQRPQSSASAISSKQQPHRRPLSSSAAASTRIAAALSPAIASRPLTAGATVTQHTPSQRAQQHCAPIDQQQRQDDGPDSGTLCATALSAHRSNNAVSTVQHYPIFAAPTRADGCSVAHALRLKWSKPIAFDMALLDASTMLDEWAPALPDTSAFVDYFARTSLVSTLVDKRNVLFKHHLHAVCFPHEFLSQDTTHSTASSGLDSGANSFRDDTVAGSPTHELVRANNSNNSSGKSKPMTLAQFSDARKQASSSSRRHLLHTSASASSLLGTTASTSATARKLAHLPFARSSFVSEASFAVRSPRPRLAPNDECDEESDESDHEVSDFERRRLAMRRDRVIDEHIEQRSSTSGTPAKLETERDAPRAHKMALDSLLTSLRAPACSQEVGNATATGQVVATYLRPTQSHDAVTLTGKRDVSLLQPLPQLPGEGDSSQARLPLRVDLQRRMETVLAALEMKPKAKLELVLKYTHAAHYDRFELAVTLWEQALHYVTKRERALARLWDFELVASDPRRHFRSLSTQRLREQKQRDALFSQLHYATDVCRDALGELERQCSDTVFVAGRAYADKMAKDYTELLFAVEQERLRLIYSDVQPALAPLGNAGAERVSGDNDSGDARLEHRTVDVAEHERNRPAATLTARNCKPSAVSPLPLPMHESNNADDAAQSLQLAGAASVSGVRHGLSNPEESIFVSVAELREQHEAKRAARDRQEQTVTLSASGQQQQRRPTPHATSHHRMAQRVQLERQNELQALTQRLQTETCGHASNDEVRHASRVATPRGRDCTKVTAQTSISSTSVSPSAIPAAATKASDELALLQRALHRFLHRPQDTA